MSAQVLSIDTPAAFKAALTQCVELLRAGELVGLPTETVYGLAANALHPEAVARIFAVKGRPAHNPVIVHVAGVEMARRCVAEWTPPAEKLAAAFWPGPLTLILPRSGIIPDLITAGGQTVGVRWPSHPFIQAVIRRCDFPLAAPSANLSSQISPTTAEHVRKSLGDKIRLIIDGGPSHVGIESTVLDLTCKPARVLRPGMIHDESLVAVLGELQPAERGRRPDAGEGATPEIVRSPGLLLKHYSPQARLVIWQWQDEEDLKSQISNLKSQIHDAHILAHTRIPFHREFGRVSVMPHDPQAFARAIYAELHRSDEAGAKLIVVEALPDAGEWQAITDRLRRAAA